MFLSPISMQGCISWTVPNGVVSGEPLKDKISGHTQLQQRKDGGCGSGPAAGICLHHRAAHRRRQEMVVTPCPEATAEGDGAGGLAAGRNRELLLRRTPHDETTGNSAPRRRDRARGAEEAGGHSVGHVRAAGARDGGGVRVQGGAGGEAARVAGEVAGGRAAAGPRQVRHGGRRRLVPRQVGVRARGRRRGGLRAVVSGPDRMSS